MPIIKQFEEFSCLPSYLLKIYFKISFTDFLHDPAWLHELLLPSYLYTRYYFFKKAKLKKVIHC